MAKEIELKNKDNGEIINEYYTKKAKEKEEDILQYNEEDLYLKNIGFEEEENSNGGMKENDDIVINKKMLKNKDFVNSAISNTPFNQNIINISDEEKEVKDKNNDKNGDGEEKKNNIINENQELVLDVLVSLKKITDVNGCCAPGNFEENDDTFFGIIPFTITMIEEIYEVRARMVADLKDQKIIEDYGKT